MAWGRSSMMLSSDSQAPRGLPGRFTTSLSFLAPTTPRESAAIGVFFIPSARMSSARPGIFFSTTARVASGVTSRGPSPVPPEVKTASQSSPSVQARSVSRMRPASSGKTSIGPTSHPRLSSNSRTAGPERSSRLPPAAASLRTRIFARRGMTRLSAVSFQLCARTSRLAAECASPRADGFPLTVTISHCAES